MHARKAVRVLAPQRLLPALAAPVAQRPLRRRHEQVRCVPRREPLPAQRSAVHSARIRKRLRQQPRQQQTAPIQHLPILCGCSHVHQRRCGGQRQLGRTRRRQLVESLQCCRSRVLGAQALGECVGQQQQLGGRRRHRHKHQPGYGTFGFSGSDETELFVSTFQIHASRVLV